MEKNISVGAERIRELGAVNSLLNNNIPDLTKKSPATERLSPGKYRIYWDYLEWLGLSDDQNLVVLSPGQHYYYDDEDLKEVTTVLNLKHLNHIKIAGDFLKTINHMLSGKSFFVGSFIDRRNQFSFFPSASYPDNSHGIDPVENGISSRFPLLNLLYDFIDSRTNNRNMTKKSVSSMLENAGFKVLDMTEINGITCFCGQKIAHSDEGQE